MTQFILVLLTREPFWIEFYFQSGLISSKGYPVEDHEVHTKDGFILGLQRIPRGRNEHSDGMGPYTNTCRVGGADAKKISAKNFQGPPFEP